ncbi:hypothetical protein LWI28_003632 [Acer negundo]|uniref:Uncharacterized protein n=1 Tax=Acer negundo TaxID=4023 RepID=A0AAD5JC72_ACENE|nr:hypothetical protein LWI28_003632 [Acer negundo]KAK4856072.1 hypothetical protein QYF36_013813 [Acer negundo]
MADNMETDTCSGFKRRMKDIQHNHFHQEQQEPSGSFSTFTAQDSQESSDITFSTSKDDDSKNIEICPGFCKKVRCSYDEKKKQLGFGIEEHLESEEVRDFLVSEGNSVDSCVEVDETENCEVCCVADVGETLNGVEKSLLSNLVGKEDKDFVKIEEGFSASQEFEKFNQENEPEVVVEMGSITNVDSKENLPTYSIFAVGESNGVLMGKEMKSQTLLDTDNNRMLTELGHGTIFVGKTLVGGVVAGLATISQIDEKRSGCEEVHKIMQKDDEKIAGLNVIDESVRSSLKIEVIDDTALIESVQDIGIEGTAKKIGWKGKKKEKKQESDGKKVKQSRRKAKDTKRYERMKNTTPIMEDQDGSLKNGEQSRKMYSRQEMEALRFVNIVEQRKLWNAIYTGLGLEVSNEYDQLANSKQKNTLLNFDPRKRFSRKLESPGILSAVVARKRRNHFNIFVH